MKSVVFEGMLSVELPRYVRKQIPIAACLYLGQIIVGYGMLWSSPVIPKLRNPEQTPLNYTITITESSWVGSTFYIGSMALFPIGYISNKFGRRLCLMLAGVLNILAFSLITWAIDVSMIYVGRTISGFSLGTILAINLVYIGEIASQNIRGIILTATGVFDGLGILLIYSVGPFVSYEFIGYIMIALSVLYLLGMLFIPESPVFFVLKDKEIEARRTLEKLGRNEDIETELQTMMEKAEEYKHKHINFHEVFTKKSNVKALIICSTLNSVHHCNGVVTFMMFAMTVMEKSISVVEPFVESIVFGIITCLGSLIASIFVDKYGRNFLLIISCTVCCLSMAILGTYFYLLHTNHYSIDYLGWVPITMLVISLFAYDIGLGIIPNALTGEMFRPNVRGTGAALSLSMGYIAGFICSSSFNYIVHHLGAHVSFWLFAAVNGFCLIFVIFFVPETRGKSLTEIESMLAR